jgi:hypothetical protein
MGLNWINLKFEFLNEILNTFLLIQILFDTSKKEMLNPNQGYQKMVKKLRRDYKCEINKQELTLKRMKECNMLLLGGPRLPFNA